MQETRDRSCPLVTVEGTDYWHVDGTAAEGATLTYGAGPCTPRLLGRGCLRS